MKSNQINKEKRERKENDDEYKKKKN